MTTENPTRIQPPPHREVVSRGDALASTARGGVANLLGAGLAGVAGLGVTWLVARGLGAEQAGSFFAATAAFTLVGGVARLGTVTGLVYWPARLRALSTPELIGACLRVSLPPVFLAGLALTLVTYWLAPIVTPEYADPLRALAFFLPLAALADALLAATRGYRQMRPTVLLEKITRPALQLILLAAVFLVGAPVAVWAVAWAAPFLPVCVAAGYLLWRAFRAGSGFRVESWRKIRPRSVIQRSEDAGMGWRFWRFTAPRALANVAQTALQRIDVLLVAALAGLAPAAAYSVAGRFVVVGQLANGAISQAVQPRLAEALAVGDLPTARRLYQTATGWLILTSWPLHLTVLQYAGDYLGLFGAHYRQAVPVVRVLALAMLLATGCGMVDMVLAMGGRTVWNLVNVLAALTAMVAADLLLIPALGIAGAAIGLACAVAVNNLLPLAQIVVSMRLHPFGGDTLAAALLTAVSFGAVPAALHASPPWLAIGAGAVAYLLGVVLLRRRLPLTPLSRRV
ncbi:MAG: multi antimicrobial extrusion protein MatE [Hamadaea sp.]|uniref:lipopolysaccharide biosynthesis protein n=1 Tax=Hamadaea sp. TaxID=2024425 RepID=UPI0018169843|nr:polysaccharide biosynthesis C-terminal domain-containing protein [Hamadaea sp.]NUR52593.1 multi antimicrobial extrusion protein MatE [Hamadaea sp.]NUR73274.1 multi antimicrobial extrusion protein MatE [Hamadaea sp.]NUT23477.1 multi antimicrobial extrusion protein MatE [Hamadaea sp.]